MEKLAIHGGQPVRDRPFATFPEFGEEERAALNEVLDSGIWGGYNPKVEEFERAFADLHQARFGITAANGTVTLEAALLASGTKPGDEVIVPPISFVATATAVLRVGAVPVFADIDGDTLNLDPSRVRESLTDRTRALIPVHFAGQPADMDELVKIASEKELIVIEDSAHAHGGAWKGKSVGSIGDFGSFSFQASKNLTAGEGGFLTTNSEELAENARAVCNQGRRTGGAWYEHFSLGTNYRITGWQAAVLLAQLARLPEQLRRRAANAKVLDEQLRSIDHISMPVVDERVTSHSYYLYPIRLDLDKLPGVTKDAFVKALNAEGVTASAGYPHPLYKNEVFDNYEHRAGHCPEAERMCADTFWLSHEIMLADAQELSDVTAAFEKIFDSVEELTSRASRSAV